MEDETSSQSPAGERTAKKEASPNAHTIDNVNVARPPSDRLDQEDEDTDDDDEENEEHPYARYVTKVRPNDVLLGRGTGPNNNEGNVVFRTVVEALKQPYLSTSSRIKKRQLVRQAVEKIRNENGRFLSRLNKGEIRRLGLMYPTNPVFGGVMNSKRGSETNKRKKSGKRRKIGPVYEVVEDSVATEKTKQALRYICYKKDNPKQKKKDEKDKETGEEESNDEHFSGDDDVGGEGDVIDVAADRHKRPSTARVEGQSDYEGHEKDDTDQAEGGDKKPSPRGKGKERRTSSEQVDASTSASSSCANPGDDRPASFSTVRKNEQAKPEHGRDAASAVSSRVSRPQSQGARTSSAIRPLHPSPLLPAPPIQPPTEPITQPPEPQQEDMETTQPALPHQHLPQRDQSLISILDTNPILGRSLLSSHTGLFAPAVASPLLHADALLAQQILASAAAATAAPLYDLRSLLAAPTETAIAAAAAARLADIQRLNYSGSGPHSALSSLLSIQSNPLSSLVLQQDQPYLTARQQAEGLLAAASTPSSALALSVGSPLLQSLHHSQVAASTPVPQNVSSSERSYDGHRANPRQGIQRGTDDRDEEQVVLAAIREQERLRRGRFRSPR